MTSAVAAVARNCSRPMTSETSQHLRGIGNFNPFNTILKEGPRRELHLPHARCIPSTFLCVTLTSIRFMHLFNATILNKCFHSDMEGTDRVDGTIIFEILSWPRAPAPSIADVLEEKFLSSAGGKATQIGSNKCLY